MNIQASLPLGLFFKPCNTCAGKPSYETTVQIEIVLLIASERFPESSVVPSFLVSKIENESFPCTHILGERTRHAQVQYNMVRQ